jgi:hypothetical protein
VYGHLHWQLTRPRHQPIVDTHSNGKSMKIAMTFSKSKMKERKGNAGNAAQATELS